MIPNLMGSFTHNPATLKTYITLGDIFEASGLNVLEQQVVALTVSFEKICTYCMAAPTAISNMILLEAGIYISFEMVKNFQILS
jgi:alkylhydroperoxidase family enzyme